MRGDKIAVDLVNKVYKSVKAYRTFLRSRKFNFSNVTTIEEFRNLPLTSKKNYRLSYETKDLLWEKEVPSTIYSSSGSSGYPTYWPLGSKSEERDGELHHYLFKNVFEIEKSSKILIIVSFAMGLWIAGVYTLLAARYLNNKGYKITTITPGIDKTNALRILEKVAVDYDEVVLAGYPPFVTDIINLLSKTKFIPKSLKIISGGDKCTEEWRYDIRRKLNNKIKHTDLANIYGTSDAAIIAHETQLSIFIRTNACKNKELYKDLFGNSRILPALFQYDPKEVFIEIVEGELVLTIDGSIPLIRYAIQDTGKVFSPTEVKSLLKKHGLLQKAKKQCRGSFNLPLLCVTGRLDVAVTLYALNIYPENIAFGLSKNISRRFLTGNYLAYTKEVGKEGREVLYIDIEVRKDMVPLRSDKEKICSALFDGLMSTNIEYKKVYDSFGKLALPNIKFIQSGKLPSTKRGVKTFTHVYGKKPRMLE